MVREVLCVLTIAVWSLGGPELHAQLVEHQSGLFYGPGERIRVIDLSGVNLAYTRQDERIRPELTRHSEKMPQAVLQVDDNIYMIYGYGITAPVVMVGDEGLVVVDPGETTSHGEETQRVFRDVTGIDLPVVGIVYTHNHIDHVAGVRGWANDEDVASGTTRIYAHETLVDAVANWSSNVGAILGQRTSYTGGSFTEVGVHGSINTALGAQFQTGPIGFMLPTHTFSDVLDISIPGLRMELHYVPSETDDEIVVWLPDQKVVHAAEVLQGENFPNMHTIRGTKARDASVWYTGIDQLRGFEAELMVNAHGRPVEGQAAVEDVLVSYRDAIQYVHDQSVRAINLGMRPFEMIEFVKLPPHLADHPWLGEFYGTVSHSVQQQYSNYIGFFHADPWQLEPMQYNRRAEETVRMMGGRDAVLRAAEGYVESGDFTFAAEILTNLITMNVHDAEAKALKAEAYRRWGYDQININWRNWAMAAAGELDGTLDFSSGADFTSADVLAVLPTVNIMSMMTVRLKAEETLDLHFATNLRLTDTAEDFSFEIRRGVVQLHTELLDDATTQVELTRAVLNRLLLEGAAAMQEGIESGEIVFAVGDLGSLTRFLGYFEQPLASGEISLIVR